MATSADKKVMDPTLKSEHVLMVSTMARHPSAKCEQAGACSWERPERPSTHAEAIEHAQTTGHQVRLEEVTVTVLEVHPR